MPGAVSEKVYVRRLGVSGGAHAGHLGVGKEGAHAGHGVGRCVRACSVVV
jgi:hypothetical protein